MNDGEVDRNHYISDLENWLGDDRENFNEREFEELLTATIAIDKTYPGIRDELSETVDIPEHERRHALAAAAEVIKAAGRHEQVIESLASDQDLDASIALAQAARMMINDARFRYGDLSISEFARIAAVSPATVQSWLEA